jgi:hypothetical protein
MPIQDKGVRNDRLNDDEVIGKLNLNTLLDLFCTADTLDQSREERVYAEITKRWKLDKAAATEDLIAAEVWLLWWQMEGDKLQAEQRREAALTWLCCPLWKSKQSPDLCLEDWKQAVEYLTLRRTSPGLSVEDIKNYLIAGNQKGQSGHWPMDLKKSKWGICINCRVIKWHSRLCKME